MITYLIIEAFLYGALALTGLVLLTVIGNCYFKWKYHRKDKKKKQEPPKDIPRPRKINTRHRKGQDFDID